MKTEGFDSLGQLLNDFTKASISAKREIDQSNSNSKTVAGKDLKEALIIAVKDPTHGKSASEKLIKDYNISQQEAADQLVEIEIDRILNSILEVN